MRLLCAVSLATQEDLSAELITKRQDMENFRTIPWSTSAVMRRFCLHVLLLSIGVSVLWQQQQSGGHTGGAAEAQSCGPRLSARFLLDIPCDMSRSAFCNVPGSSYPWHAVRRYIFENQGLVRRMYGDQRHSLIMGNELEERRLRYDDLRYHVPVPPPDEYTDAETGPRGRAAYRVRPNSRYANLLKTSPQADDEKVRPPPPPPPSPSQRPPAHSGGATVAAAVVTTAGGTSSVAATTGAVPVATAPAILQNDATVYRPGSPTQVVFHDEPVDSERPPAATETSQAEPLRTAATAVPAAPTHAPGAPGTTTATTTASIKDQTSSDTTAATDVGEFEPSYAAGEPFTHEPEPLHAYATSLPSSTSATAEPLVGLLDSNSIEPPERPLAPDVGRPANAEGGTGEVDDDSSASSTDQPPKKGVNACPVKQEVLAPYWANNTRGKVLALLNVYPFEQYVHAEKCAFENQQMFCRDGCRCEQQFRLHRLLAFDPRNECRGIFADWFRFPSCCVCICYDIGSPASPPVAASTHHGHHWTAGRRMT